MTDESRTAPLSPEQIAEELERWRGWAQFVYLGGGPVTLDDEALKSAVCAAHDERVAQQVAQERERLRAFAEEMLPALTVGSTGLLLSDPTEFFDPDAGLAVVERARHRCHEIINPELMQQVERLAAQIRQGATPTEGS